MLRISQYYEIVGWGLFVGTGKIRQSGAERLTTAFVDLSDLIKLCKLSTLLASLTGSWCGRIHPTRP